jgi:predicted nucleotidyltransferase
LDEVLVARAAVHYRRSRRGAAVALLRRRDLGPSWQNVRRETGERIMLTLLAEKLPELERLCKLHGVRRLEVVGSAAREVDFDQARSDFDFLVEFEPGRLPATLSAFFGFREALAQTVGRPVDLLMLEAVRNPYVKANLERNRLLLYAA